LHGGILAALLDETVGRAAYLVQEWVFTAKVEVRFRQPAPLGQQIRFEGRLVRRRGKFLELSGSALLRNGTVLAEARGLYVLLPEDIRSQAEAIVLDEPAPS
jgi:acyl-coenzyme A thioesterase PaaI-like protein